MELCFWICVLFTLLCVVQSAKVKQPRILAVDNNLIFDMPEGKDVHIHSDKFYVNDMEVTSTLKQARRANLLLSNYETIISQYNSRLNDMNSKVNGTSEVPDQNFTQLTAPLLARIQRFGRRITILERNVRTMKALLTKDECVSNPCQNGGTCLDIYNGFICQCADGWEGETCSLDVNECARFIGTDLGCQNSAACLNLPGSYRCHCTAGWTGVHCNRKPTDCNSGGFELCGHGTCISQNNQVGYKCLCDAGWTNETPQGPCTVDVNECSQNHPPCSTNPLVQCINVPGSYMCQHCPPGYTGNGYYCADINECEILNGGCSVSPYVECLNIFGSSKCDPCPVGYEGDGKTCTYKGICNINNGGCNMLARCINNEAIGPTYVQCICPAGYMGNGIGPRGCRPSSRIPRGCVPNPCQNGRCVSNNSTSGFSCVCHSGYSGKYCHRPMINPCDRGNLCLNGGTCVSDPSKFLQYSCLCPSGFTGGFCQVEEQVCGNRFTSENGTLRYPLTDYDSVRFENVSTCSWIITTDRDKVLEVKFTKFKFTDPPCVKQYLEINDDESPSSRPLGRFCGSNLPLNGSFSTTQNSLYLLLTIRSETAQKTPEFALSWKSKSLECGGSLSASMGLISSPGWPSNYPNDRDCYWTYTLAPDKRMLFHIYALDIGNNVRCSDDYLEFYMKKTPLFMDPKLNIEGGDQLLTKLCNSTIPAPFYSLSPTGVIHFKSNRKNPHTGFQIGYSVENGIPGCGGVYTNPEGFIQSLELTKSMPSPLICIYQIKLPKPTTIQIEVISMKLEEDCKTNIAIYVDASTSELLTKRCGSVLPAPLSVFGSTVEIKSTSRFGLSNSWKIKYQSICHNLYSNPSGTFLIDRELSGCHFLIQQPEGRIIIMDITYSSAISGNKNLMKAYDGDSENAVVLSEFGTPGKSRVESTANYLLLVVKKARWDIHIEVNFTSIDMGCGGLLKAEMGSIAYPPRSQDKYASNSKCRWIIMSLPDRVIQLTFMTFHVEQSYNCMYDNLQVFDNNTNIGVGALVGRFCGYRLPPTILSSSNILTIDFTSDNSITGDGFLISYNQIKESNVCGGNYFTPFGVIKSPGFPDKYPSNRDCGWTITVDPGQQIMLKVLNFSLEGAETYSKHSFPKKIRSANCRYDWLEIRNGGTASSPLIGKYCGETIPKMIPSHANQIYVRFVSDMSRSSGGFKIEWDSAATGCGGSLQSPSGVIMSPQYPEPYPKKADCLWKIIVNAGSTIRAIFSDVDLEAHSSCSLDYVELFDGLTTTSKSLGKFCTLPSDSVTSTVNSMLVRFFSDISIQGRGFQMQYTAYCRNELTGFGGSIESPNFPNEYPENQNCSWTIVVPEGNKINISFSDFDLELYPNANETCTFDWVEIKYAVTENEDFEPVDSETWETYKRYCGDENPGLISLNSFKAKIDFVSDSALKGSGFRLEWILNGCGGIRQVSDGEALQSPNYPKPYPQRIQCDWVLKAPFGKTIKLHFHDINIERDNVCSYDYVQVFNGPDDTYPIISTICHQVTDTYLTATAKEIFVRFKADMSYQGTGFYATYEQELSKCGGTSTASSGYIFSPNYPNNFNQGDTCEYIIFTSMAYLIELEFEEVDLIREANCSTNYIKVYDGANYQDPILKSICGNTTDFNTTIRSSSETLMVVFSSDYHLTSKGFKAHYQRTCGANIKAGMFSGNIDYRKEFYTKDEEPDGYTPICVYTIEAEDASKHIYLTVKKILMPPFICLGDRNALLIRNGKLKDSPILGNYCSSKVPAPLTSDGSAIRIEIYYGIDFLATYSPLDEVCGGRLESAEGYLASPGWPKSYPNATECIWTLSVGLGNTITLNFLNFDIPFSDHCNLDYVEVRETDLTGKVIGVFCGNSPPTNISAIGTMVITFKSGNVDGTTDMLNKGFYAEYAMSNSNKLYGSQGYIGHLINDYGIMSRNWLITTNISTVIELTFKSLFLDAYAPDECSFSNSIKVFDGFNYEAPLLRAVCGAEMPDPILSTSNMMYIVLDVFHIRVDIKYLMEWKELPRTSAKIPSSNKTKGCQFKYDMEGEEDVNLTSPGYPTGYDADLNCEWIYEIPPQYHLTIKFTDVSLEFVNFVRVCTYADHISIYTKSTTDTDWELRKTFCGYQPLDEIHGSNLMKVVFKTNKYLQGSGFQAIVRGVCGGSMSEPSGLITLNASRDHENECQWNITVRSGRTVKLIIEEFDLGSNGVACPNYLVIRNGNFKDSPLLGKGKFCGTDIPKELESSSNYLYLKYIGTNKVGHFRIKYKEVPIQCGGYITLTPDYQYEVITSPNYPNIPHPYSECVWVVKAAASDEVLHIQFEDNFDIASYTDTMCEKEYVELRDGSTSVSPLIGRYCQSIPNPKTSTGNLLRIKYFTDLAEPRNGFKANVSISSCGGIYRKEGTFSSNEHQIKIGSVCVWWIKGPFPSKIQATILSLSVGWSKLNCSAEDNGYVELYNVGNDALGNETTLITSLCGKIQSLDEKSHSYSSGEVMKVVFRKRFADDQFALAFSFQTADCGGILNRDADTIMSPSYPVNIHSGYECSWNLLVKQGRRITFYIEDVDLLSIRSLTISESVDGPIIARRENIQQGHIYETSSNEARIFIWKTIPSAGGRFKIKYHSDKPAICTENFNQTYGEIRNPNISTPYLCKYSYPTELDAGHTFALDITLNLNKSKKFVCFQNESGLEYNDNEYTKICTNVTNLIIRINTGYFLFQAKQDEKVKVSYIIKYNTFSCGGVISLKAEGSLTSPNFPRAPNQTMECAWSIHGEQFSPIGLNFTVFDLEDDCNRNYIEIYNGPSHTSPKIGKFCKGQAPEYLVSQFGDIYIAYRYVYKKGDMSSGFSLMYKQHNEDCGGIFQSEYWYVQSPGYGLTNYGNNKECIWEIRAIEGHMVELAIYDRFFIEDSINCTKDYIEIFDWKFNTWISLGRKCGRTVPANILSSNNKLKIMFRSDENITAVGFRAFWTWKCGGLFEATKEPKYLTSPGYGTRITENQGLRHENESCSYKIVTKDPQGFVQITVLNIQGYDTYVSPSCSQINLTLKALPTGTFAFSRTDFHICRSSDIGIIRRYKQGVILNYATTGPSGGFEVMYKDDSCGGNITEPTAIEMLSSDQNKQRREMFNGRILCFWYITAPKDQIVVLSIHKLNMQFGMRCFIQSVSIYDDLSRNLDKRLARLCGQIEESKPIPSTSNNMLVVLDSYPKRFEEFKAEVYFTYGPSVGCGGTINLNNTMHLNSPIGLSHMDCHWTIVAPRDYKVQMEFSEINVLPPVCRLSVGNYMKNCTCSYIEVKDGGGSFAEQMTRICPSDNNSKTTLITSWNTAYVRLYTAVLQNDSMFHLKLTPVESKCGKSILVATDKMQELTSPDYPNSYPDEIKCVWLIKPAKALIGRFMIYFEDFNLTGASSGSCDSDKLQLSADTSYQIINEGFGPDAVQSGQSDLVRTRYSYDFCGNDTLPFDYYSSGDDVTLTFRSVPFSSEKKRRGFKLKYGTVGCNRTIHANQGVIQSDSTNNGINCSVTIVADPGRTISMYFNLFTFIYRFSDCDINSLEIREGNFTGKQLLRACGYRLPNPVFSDTNMVTLRTHTQLSKPFYRYNLLFTSSDRGKGCGGKLFYYAGSFSSPMYPNVYREDMQCTWEISVSKGYKVALKFKDFNIGGVCTKNKVIVDTFSEAGPNTLTYCQGDAPATIFSDHKLNVTYYSSVNNGGTGWLATFVTTKEANDEEAAKANLFKAL